MQGRLLQERREASLECAHRRCLVGVRFATLSYKNLFSYNFSDSEVLHTPTVYPYTTVVNMASVDTEKRQKIAAIIAMYE